MNKNTTGLHRFSQLACTKFLIQRNCTISHACVAILVLTEKTFIMQRLYQLIIPTVLTSGSLWKGDFPYEYSRISRHTEIPVTEKLYLPAGTRKEFNKRKTSWQLPAAFSSFCSLEKALQLFETRWIIWNLLQRPLFDNAAFYNVIFVFFRSLTDDGIFCRIRKFRWLACVARQWIPHLCDGHKLNEKFVHHWPRV